MLLEAVKILLFLVVIPAESTCRLLATSFDDLYLASWGVDTRKHLAGTLSPGDVLNVAAISE